ncbi:MAG: HNH endonuclease [Methylosarcina sp.]
MAKPRTSLVIPRSLAFSRQSGICCYCKYPMWSGSPHEFALKHKITIGQAKRFQCTGEHLKAHKDGGTAAQNNLAAACSFCNRKRHQRKEPLSPEQFGKLVERRMSQGRWHDVRLN